MALWGRVPKRVNTGLNHEVMGVASPTGLATFFNLKVASPIGLANFLDLKVASPTGLAT